MTTKGTHMNTQGRIMTMTSRRRALPALGLAATMLFAACSSSSKSATTSAAGSTAASTASTTSAGGATTAVTTAPTPVDPLGTPNKATGTPIKIPFAYDGKTQTVDTSGDLGAAKAAAGYVNDYLGGIAGHPIELDACESQQQPATAQQCVNNWIAAKPVMVLGDTSGVVDSFAKGISEAGIPQLWVSAASVILITSPTANIMGNVLATNYAAPAKLAKDAGATEAVELTLDTPAAVDPANQLMVPVFKNVGIKLSVVAIPPGTADMTPQVQAAIANNPGLVHITGNDTFCISAMQALRSLNYEGKIVLIGQCQSDAFNKTLKGKLAGVVLSTGFSKDPADPEVALYQAVMKKYSPDTDANGTVAYGGYASVVGLARAMKGLSGDVTSASIISQFKAMAPATMPLASTLTFKCDRTAVSFAPPFCTLGNLGTTLDADGKPSAYTPIDITGLLKLG